MDANQKNLLSQFLQGIIDDIRTRHSAAGQKSSGKTIDSLRQVIRERDGILYAAKYFRRLEDGRGPTKNSTKGNPTLKESLLEWMNTQGIKATPYRRKDGSTQDQAKANESLAFLIARSIHRFGDRLFRSGGRSGVISGAITQQRISAFVGAFGTMQRIDFAGEILKGQSENMSFEKSVIIAKFGR